MSKYAPHAQIYRDARREWRWRLVARNGNIVADSAEGYVSKRNAAMAIRSLCAAMRNMGELDVVDG